MNIKNLSLSTQIKKDIGNRVLFCSIVFMLIIICLTAYDLSNSITQLRSRINEQLKSIEDFAIDQAMINNLDAVKLKIENFNDTNATFKIKWMQSGEPKYKKITWKFPFSWVYDYGIGNIAGYKFGYFKLTGDFFSAKILIYDLLIRMILLIIFIASILIILYPLAKKIPEQLFINPINRFIELISTNKQTQNIPITNSLPIELKMLEIKILDLLKTAREHERNKVNIELGHLSARLAHDIRSPLLAMEMGIHVLLNKIPDNELYILKSGIQNVRDIANNLLERYRNNTSKISLLPIEDNGNIIRPIQLSTIIEFAIFQKNYEWSMIPSELLLDIKPETKNVRVMAASNEINRILSNLLNNAYDAIQHKKKGVIQIILENIDNKLNLIVKDNGIGIPTEKLSDVLQGTSLKPNGTGLGLSAANQYMQKLGGQLKINSILNEGTTITLIFSQIVLD